MKEENQLQRNLRNFLQRWKTYYILIVVVATWLKQSVKIRRLVYPKRMNFTLCKKWRSVSPDLQLVTQSNLTLCDPMGCSPPGSSVHGFSRQEFPSPGDLPNAGTESKFSTPVPDTTLPIKLSIFLLISQIFLEWLERAIPCSKHLRHNSKQNKNHCPLRAMP